MQVAAWRALAVPFPATLTPVQTGALVKVQGAASGAAKGAVDGDRPLTVGGQGQGSRVASTAPEAVRRGGGGSALDHPSSPGSRSPRGDHFAPLAVWGGNVSQFFSSTATSSCGKGRLSGSAYSRSNSQTPAVGAVLRRMHSRMAPRQSPV